jgi:hypothetical protein
MAQDISNRTLAAFVIIATVVSVGGFFVSIGKLSDMGLTGMATTDTGVSNFSINSTISVVFTTNSVDFGQGVINTSGSHNCTLNTTGPGMLNGGTNGLPSVDCAGFYNTVQPLRIQNQGTQNVTLNLSFNATPAQWIGGTTPGYTFRPTVNESGACGTGGQFLNNVSVIPVTVANTNYSICNSTGFNWITGSRTLNIDLGMRIPSDAPSGERRVTITAYAST